jgi:aminopeptidase
MYHKGILGYFYTYILHPDHQEFKGANMSDPRVTKLAKVLIGYSLDIKPGQKLHISTNPLASELTLAVYEQAIKAGAHVFVEQPMEELNEIFYKFASDEQLDFVHPVRKFIIETYDADLVIDASSNRRMLSGVDPKHIARSQKARADLMKTFMERSARHELAWCLTVYPNNANAQDADMSLRDYTEFVFAACMLNEDNPIAFWQEEGRRQVKLVEWLKGRDRVALKGSNIDMTLSIKDRTFEPCDGKYNFPDGEIFTGPVEDSASGWVRFRYPAIFMGQEITDIELWFEKGKVVREKASKNQELLTSTLNTDEGARYLGEWGIGTNYGITKFTKDMLFDEKIGGTIHFALGASYPETGGKNESAIHWDMLCDMADSEVTVDDELFYKDGKTVIG